MVTAGLAHEQLAGTVVIVEPDDEAALDPAALRSLTALFIARQPLAAADAVIGEGGVDLIVEAAERSPMAAIALVLLLRGTEGRSVEDGLVAESTVYSMLQGGPEFSAWRQGYSVRPRLSEIGPAVRMERTGDRLHLTLSRPHVHNAFSRRLRDELADALTLVAADDSLESVLLDGAGPSFCSGGDLTEFGTFPDPVRAHLIRLTRSPARLMAAVGHRMEVHLHGACMGAGIELPAFARHVVAHPDTMISLPEMGLGLIPGAGGTVSLPRRIGRHRTAWLALTGARIDAETALAWGLVDEIAEIAQEG